MSLKIQIASIAALERLIGGDSEIEIELRNSVVHEFAKRHLKGMMGEALEAQSRELKKELARRGEEILIREFGTMKAPKDRFGKAYLVLNEQTKEALALAAQNAAAVIRTEFIGVVEDRIAKMVEARFSPERLDAMIEERFRLGVEEVINEKVDEKLQALKDAL